MTDAEYAAWLSDPNAQRVTLYEVGANDGSEITVYMSNKPYNGGTSAAPYLPIVSAGIKPVSSISLMTEARFAAGDVRIANPDGKRDAWLDYIWVNKPFRVYIGDARWPRTEFKHVFEGRVEDISGTDARDTLVIRLRDKLQALNTPVTDAQMGTNAPGPLVLRPTLLGEVHNITPKLKNKNTSEFEFNAFASEALIEVRSDGKPRNTVVNLSTGSFTLTEPKAIGPGTLTCSAQGVKPSGTYSNKIADLVQFLITQTGKVSDRFTLTDIDTANFAAFNSANTQAVGLWIPERMNVLEACNLLAGSIGAQLVPTSTGLMRLIQIVFPTVSTNEIRADDRIDKTIRLVEETKVVGSVRLGYCKNYTVQDNLQTTIPNEHKELFAQEYLIATDKDDAVLAAYKLDNAPDLQTTCLQTTAAAQAEATRRLNIFKVKRRTYRFEAPPICSLLELGQDVKLFSSRYNLSTGKVGVVTGLSYDWDTYRVIVEVTI